MAKQKVDAGGLGRFGEPGVLILPALSNEPKHGYAITITTDVLQQTGVRLGPGTLYGSLTKLVGRVLVIALPSDDRRRPYEITRLGRVALAEHLATWSRVRGDRPRPVGTVVIGLLLALHPRRWRYVRR